MLETTATPLPAYDAQGQDIPQDHPPQYAGRANERIKEQPVEQDNVQLLQRQLDHNLDDPHEDFFVVEPCWTLSRYLFGITTTMILLTESLSLNFLMWLHLCQERMDVPFGEC